MKKRLFTVRDVQVILTLISLGIVLTAGLLFANWWLAGRFGAGADFIPVWNGAREGWRALFLQPVDPYGTAITETSQRLIYGRLAQGGEYPYALDIPFPLLILFFPFAFIPDPVWARAVWMLLTEAGLFALVTLAFRLADWRPNRWFYPLALVFSVTWFFSVVSILDAGMSVLLTLALVGALSAMRDFNDEAAGILLAAASFHLEATFLLWLFILLGVIVARRWRVFFGFGITWIILGAVAFLTYPAWVWPFLRAVAANWRADDILTPVHFLTRWFPAYGLRLWYGLAGLLVVIIVFEWLGGFTAKDFRRVAWVAALSLAVTPLMGMSTTFSNLAALVFPIAVIFPFAWERWEKRTYLVLTVIVLLFFALPLILQLPSVAALVPADGLNYLLTPALTILGLYWVRWYAVRPPRTWLDGVRRELRR